MDKFNYVGGKYFDIMVKNLYLIEVIYPTLNTTILNDMNYLSNQFYDQTQFIK